MARKSLRQAGKEFARGTEIAADIITRAATLGINPVPSPVELAAIGTAKAVSGLAGLLVGDQPMVLQMDYIAVPAYEYGPMLQGIPPSHRLLLKEGEVLYQVQPTEAMETEEALTGGTTVRRRRRRLSPYQRFVRDFKFRPKRKNEDGREYGKERMRAVSRAWKRHKRS